MKDFQQNLCVFVVLGGIVRASSVRTAWDFPLISEVFSICTVLCGKCMRPCFVSMTTLLFLMKCNPKIGLVSFLIPTKCSASVLSPMSSLSVAVANGFSN